MCQQPWKTRRQALSDARARLEKAGATDAALDAQWLLSAVTEVPRLLLLAQGEEALSAGEAERFSALVKKRASGMPLQYVLGEAAFMGRVFRVNEHTLIPRGDTERLCEAALQRLREDARALDIGTGSGALAVSMALYCPGASVWAVDISPEALKVARENAARLGAAVRFRESDLFSALTGEAFDLIVSNPPYIETAALPTLQAEVRREPRLALDGGADGLSFYRRIAAALPGHLRPGGSLLLEAGDGQAGAVSEMLERMFAKVEIHKDYSGLDRVLIGDGYAG